MPIVLPLSMTIFVVNKANPSGFINLISQMFKRTLMKIIGNIHDDLKRKYPISRPYILYIRIVYTIMYEIIASAGPNMN